MSLTEQVRRHAAQVAAHAVSVRIEPDALAAAPETASAPPLEPVAGAEEDVAGYVLALTTIGFGASWSPPLRRRRGQGVEETVASTLADRVRAHGAWTGAELRALRTDELADALGQPRDHELVALQAQALRSLGRWLRARGALAAVREEGAGSAERLAASLAGAVATYADRGLFARAQRVPAELARAGVAAFSDLDRLTLPAGDLLPHVLRTDGVLAYEERLAAHVDAGRPLRPGPQEHEIRACAVHAGELLAGRLGLGAHELGERLAGRAGEERYAARPRHRCATVFY